MLFGLLCSGAWSGCAPAPGPHHDGGTEEHGDEHGDDHGDEHHDEHEDEHGSGHDGEEVVVTLSPEARARIGLATAIAELRPLAGSRETTGALGFDENRLAHVSPRVEGRLVRVPGELGATVTAGQTLAVIDSMELGEAKAGFLRARARHEVARGRFERERDLRSDRIASEQEVLDAEGAAREAAADLASARATLRLLGLRESEIEDLSWEDAASTEVAVRAPFGGKIIERDATPGELVDPHTVLFTLADLSRVWLWVDLYERDLAHVQLGQEVQVTLDALGQERLEGKLNYIADQVTEDSRTVRARVDLPNPEGRLKPGMFARVSLAAQDLPTREALTVPRAAIQRDGNQPIAFVATDSPDRFERREVRLGEITETLAEVVAGLEAGDEVVTEGAFLLRSQASADELGGHHHH
jgi:cobalt-zinc-cadmium efflux system membrane fusion protein